jgi:hypothetical protein
MLKILEYTSIKKLSEYTSIKKLSHAFTYAIECDFGVRVSILRKEKITHFLEVAY